MLDATFYQSMFARSPIGTLVLSPSAEPIILDVNEAFLRDVGHTREQLVGQPLFEALPAAPGDPEDPGSSGVTALRNALARVVASGEPQPLTTSATRSAGSCPTAARSSSSASGRSRTPPSLPTTAACCASSM